MPSPYGHPQPKDLWLPRNRAVRCVIASNVASLASVPVAQDGLTLAKGDRVLLVGQTNQVQNGIYAVQSVTGSNCVLAFDDDFNAASDLESGLTVYCQEGTVYAGAQFRMTTALPITFGSTNIIFALVPAPRDLKLPVGFGTADAAVLYTVPTGQKLRVNRVWWEITTGFTGGTSSTIGLSSSNSGYSTKGDLQGGASGDAAAALVAGNIGGTIGAKFGSNGVVVLNGGDTIRFDRITSAFTAGAGFAHVEVVPVS